MCEHGKQVEMSFNVIRLWEDGFGDNLNKEYWKNHERGHFFSVDACISYQVWKMNTLLGIRTLNSCCGHGVELSDDDGQILIDSHSVYNAIKNDYDVRIFHRWWDGLDGAEYEMPTYEIRLF